MSCDCENIACLDLYVSPCAASVDTGLIATVAGNWIALFEFNGVWKQQELEFEVDDHIILDNQFNGNYTHTLKLFMPDGSLFNDTCYTMNINLVINGSSGGDAPILMETITTNVTYIIKDSPDPDAGNGTQIDPYQLQSGTSITVPLFINKIVHEPQVYNTGLEYLIFAKNSLGKATNAIFTRNFSGNEFYDGEIITFSYEA